jgi:hypothetical protein
MRIFLGILLGYNIQHRDSRLIRIIAIALVLIYVVIPFIALGVQGIALMHLGLSVQRERLARPKQTKVPSLKGLDYQAATKQLRDSHLNVRVIATRYGLPQQPNTVVDQSPAAGEHVDYDYPVAVTITASDPQAAGP